MSTELITVKVEPPDEFSVPSNSVSPAISQTGSVADNNETLSSVSGSSSVHNDTRNFTCLLCDVICDSRDDLRKHLKIAHTSKNYGISSAMFAGRFPPDMTNGINLTTYMNYRYTCSLCSAKFKSFRSYLSHSMSHRGTGSYTANFDDARMATLLGSGKQYLRDYMDQDDSYPGTFTCDECKTVFMQRDAYAMHMMTRAMNESCQQPPSPKPPLSIPTEPEDNNSDRQSESCAVSPRVPNTDVETTTSSSHVQDRCLEDVTAKIDQDEYLKSVLDKVFVTESSSKPDNSIEVDLSSTADDRKMCTFCDETFSDQDNLAMHVMSDHSEEMTHKPGKKRSARAKAAINGYHGFTSAQPIDIVYSCRLCDETFSTRDTLAMHVLSHAHRDDMRLGYNPYKRVRTERDPSAAMAENAKILRTMEHIHKMSFNSNIYAPQTRGGPKLPVSSLYCSVCGVEFYSHTELEWHKRQHFEPLQTSDVQPLCLVKTPENSESSSSKAEESSAAKEERSSPFTKQRRNSFSACDQLTSNADDTSPQRPFSTGDVSSSDGTSVKFLSEINKKKTGEEGDDSHTLAKNSILPAVNALSSNEQRIIYSVFGKDLGLSRTNTPEDYSKPNDIETYSDKPAEKENSKLSTYETAKDERQGRRSSQPNGSKDTPMCKFCQIIFLNKAIYYLHMGLHNVNNPWQCNICGKVCKDAVDFTAHVIHM